MHNGPKPKAAVAHVQAIKLAKRPISDPPSLVQPTVRNKRLVSFGTGGGKFVPGVRLPLNVFLVFDVAPEAFDRNVNRPAAIAVQAA